MGILILTAEDSNRAEYIFRLIFNNLLKTEFRITHDRNEFISFDKAKINYTHDFIENALNIVPCTLLFEKGIFPPIIETIIFENVECPFKINAVKSDFPFDPFSAIFYLVSRYEEYLPFVADSCGRFEADQSLSYKLGFIEKPIVNIWIRSISEKINQLFPESIKFKPNYSFITTYDIDIAYSYLGKPIFRGLATASRDMMYGKFGKVKERSKVLLGSLKDPYDSYDYIEEIHKKYELKPIFFIHPGTYGKVDKNISLENNYFKSLISRLKQNSEIGIHPSYRSVDEPELLKKEINRLSLSSGLKITKSRQHFIYLKFPETFRNYIETGITDDYSLGYASQTGFRAGICSSFFFYDLVNEEETKLLCHPFAFMDGAVKNYMKLNIEESILHLAKIIDEVKKVNGTFISLWHNETLAETEQWKGWRKVYEFMIEKAIS